MPITFTCPNPQCAAKMTVPDSLAGKRGKCSKCKEAVVVPGQVSNGAPPAAPATKEKVAASAPTTSRPATPPKPSAPPPPAAPEPSPVEPPHVDLDEAAMSALVDEPTEQEKASNFIDFECPQCNEMVKFPLAEAGKRAQCPECRRIIQIPIPKNRDKADWRDTGPKLPTGAKRDDGPAPEGAWGTAAAARVGHETLKEVGLIKEPEKPLTLYQKLYPYLFFGTPVVVVLALGVGIWMWLFRNQEKNALNYALTAATSETGRKALGVDGQVLLQSGAGGYFITDQTPGCASKAREHYGKAIALAGSSRNQAMDALLGEMAVASLELGGGPDQTDTDRKIDWRETSKLLRAILAGIRSHPARLWALQRVTGALIDHGQTDRILPLIAQLYTAENAERCEALAVVGLELNRLGQKSLAKKALLDIAPIYKDKKKRPILRPAIVALYLTQGEKPPEHREKDLSDEEAAKIGQVEGKARLGETDAARTYAKNELRAYGGKFRGLLALATGDGDPKKVNAEDLNVALEAARDAGSGPDLPWQMLRLVELGIQGGIGDDRLELAIKEIKDPSLQAWGRMMVARAKIKISNGVEPVGLVKSIPANTIAGLLARQELARHNTYHSTGWASTVNSWEEAPRALGSLGVAIGMQAKR